jgi:hypothetical protein
MFSLIWRDKARQKVGGCGEITEKLVADTDSGLVATKYCYSGSELVINCGNSQSVQSFSRKRPSV